MSRARPGDGSAPTSGTSEVSRVLTSGACGLVVAAALALLAPWEVTVLSAWIVGAAIFAGRVWHRTHGLSAAETAKVATREDASRGAAHLMVIGAAVASLVGVGVTLAQASTATGATKVVLTTAA